MTDVLILKRIPGHRRGEIVPRSARLEQHIKAGNAKILPNEHEAWNGAPHSEPVKPVVPSVVGNMPHDHDHLDEPAELAGDPED